MLDEAKALAVGVVIEARRSPLCRNQWDAEPCCVELHCAERTTLETHNHFWSNVVDQSADLYKTRRHRSQASLNPRITHIESVPGNSRRHRIERPSEFAVPGKQRYFV